MLAYKPTLTSDGCATVGEALARWAREAPCLHRELVDLPAIAVGVDTDAGGRARASEEELEDVARRVWHRIEERTASYYRREPRALEVASLWTTSARGHALPVPIKPKFGVELRDIDEVLVEMRANNRVEYVHLA